MCWAAQACVQELARSAKAVWATRGTIVGASAARRGKSERVVGCAVGSAVELCRAVQVAEGATRRVGDTRGVEERALSRRCRRTPRRSAASLRESSLARSLTENIEAQHAAGCSSLFWHRRVYKKRPIENKYTDGEGNADDEARDGKTTERWPTSSTLRVRVKRSERGRREGEGGRGGEERRLRGSERPCRRTWRRRPAAS